MKIPFCLTKEYRKTKGLDREISKIRYYNGETYDSEKRIIGLKYSVGDEYDYALNDLNKKYNKIDAYDYEVNKINIKYSKINNDKKLLKERDIALLQLKLKYNKIDKLDYEKEYNELLENPWCVYNIEYNPSINDDEMNVSVLYNSYFIKRLKKLGYDGDSDDDIIENWISQFMATNILQGDFLDEDDIVETEKVGSKVIVR